MFEVADKKRPSASGRENVPEPGPSENEEKDESAASSSGATTGDSQTGNQQSDDQAAPGNNDDVVQVGPDIQRNNKKSDGPAQPNITYNVVMNIHENSGVITIGNKNLAKYIKNPKVGNKEEAEDAENNDQNAEDDDAGDQTDNIPVVVDQRAAEENVNDETDISSVVVFQSGVDVFREVIDVTGGQADIKDVDCEVFVAAVVKFLHLDPTSSENPPPEIMKNCRKLCGYLKKQNRLDIFEELKLTLPNGMTGPRGDERKKFQELSVKDQDKLTKAMTGNEMLLKRLVTELLGESTSQIGYYVRQDNPAEKILDKLCQKRRLLIGELYYDILVRYGAASLADEFL